MNMLHKNAMFWVTEERYIIPRHIATLLVRSLGHFGFFSRVFRSNTIRGRESLKGQGLHMGIVDVAFRMPRFLVPPVDPLAQWTWVQPECV